MCALLTEVQTCALPIFKNTEFLSNAVQVVIVGDRSEAATGRLARAVLDRSLPDRLLRVLDAGATLPATHPAAGKTRIEGRPTAYVCRGMTCAAPVTDPAALSALLELP